MHRFRKQKSYLFLLESSARLNLFVSNFFQDRRCCGGGRGVTPVVAMVVVVGASGPCLHEVLLLSVTCANLSNDHPTPRPTPSTPHSTRRCPCTYYATVARHERTAAARPRSRQQCSRSASRARCHARRAVPLRHDAVPPIDAMRTACACTSRATSPWLVELNLPISNKCPSTIPQSIVLRNPVCF